MGFRIGKLFNTATNFFSNADEKAELNAAKQELENDRSQRALEIAKARKGVTDNIDKVTNALKRLLFDVKNESEGFTKRNSGFKDTDRNNYQRFL